MLTERMDFEGQHTKPKPNTIYKSMRRICVSVCVCVTAQSDEQ